LQEVNKKGNVVGGIERKIMNIEEFVREMNSSFDAITIIRPVIRRWSRKRKRRKKKAVKKIQAAVRRHQARNKSRKKAKPNKRRKKTSLFCMTKV